MVKFGLSIVNFKKAKEMMEGTSLLSPNSKFCNTKTMLKWFTLKNSPEWSLTRIDIIQLGLESRLDEVFKNIFYFFKNLFFGFEQPVKNEQRPKNGLLDV